MTDNKVLNHWIDDFDDLFQLAQTLLDKRTQELPESLFPTDDPIVRLLEQLQDNLIAMASEWIDHAPTLNRDVVSDGTMSKEEWVRLRNTTWTRLWGPGDTCSCGDVEYETGSLYGNKCGDRVEMCYFVEATPTGNYGVSYRVDAYSLDRYGDPNDDNEIAFDFASAVAHPTVQEAIEAADKFAAEDESWIWNWTSGSAQ